MAQVSTITGKFQPHYSGTKVTTAGGYTKGVDFGSRGSQRSGKAGAHYNRFHTIHNQNKMDARNNINQASTTLKNEVDSTIDLNILRRSTGIYENSSKKNESSNKNHCDIASNHHEQQGRNQNFNNGIGDQKSVYGSKNNLTNGPRIENSKRY